MTRPGFSELASALTELRGARPSPGLRFLQKGGTRKPLRGRRGGQGVGGRPAPTPSEQPPFLPLPRSPTPKSSETRPSSFWMFAEALHRGN